jgi:hypothetical protein
MRGSRLLLSVCLALMPACEMSIPSRDPALINPFTALASGLTSGLGTPLGVLRGANFNSTSDQAIPIISSKYVIRRIVVTNASTSLTTAAGGIYSTTAKGGTAYVAAAQVYTALTASSKFLDLTLAAALTTDIATQTTLYLSLTTGQGGAATADVFIFGDNVL